MKKIVLLNAIILSLGLMSFVQTSKSYVAINNFSNTEEGRPDRRGRAENEFVINRVSRPGPGYNIYVFHTNNGRFLTYRFNRPSTTAFTEAIIYTRNDSTFDVRLQNGANEIDMFSLQCQGTQLNLWTETK